MHGNLKKVIEFSHSHISQSQWWNCGSITVMNFSRYHNYTTQLLRKLLLTKLSQNFYLNYHWFHSKLSTHNLQNGLFKSFPHFLHQGVSVGQVCPAAPDFPRDVWWTVSCNNSFIIETICFASFLVLVCHESKSITWKSKLINYILQELWKLHTLLFGGCN